MKCLICMQAETADGLTSVAFERAEFRLVINRVPARVCPNCGEAYLEEQVAMNLLSEAENELTQGKREVVRDYDSGRIL